ncbi:uncharacterized protein LOC123309782 isoform X1 [Coccinella septempunctata]|uniref:uncharacterized protein LOC123309782 isoform X1 n=1 Tax=Coccinella septempunctata TaxID=41139 RepID=UPI001D062741|nr:uncharacterized protein LOC123309782 isoform X1 [Coccinella septempunctata]
MRESDRGDLKEPRSEFGAVEMNNNRENNNSSNRRMFDSNESLISGVSSVAACSGEDCSSRRSSEEFDSRGDIFDFPEYNREERSHSCSGLSEELNDIEPVEIFPSLPDNVLEEMGLTREQARKLQTEDELEQKFATLSLAFSIDSNTITDRCERQKRYRNQTEDNLAKEIERLTQRVNKLTKLCVNMETTELLASLLAQIDVVTNASALAASSAERYGAVQHEQRLADAVQLMINHVNTLKQQRDLSRKQLQYTKNFSPFSPPGPGESSVSTPLHYICRSSDPRRRKMLQGSSSKTDLLSKDDKGSQHHHFSTKRRASISLAMLQEQRNSEKNFLRRTSELVFRTSATQKLAKPSRMDLGVDLNKIKEGMVDENNYDFSDSQSEKNATGCDDSDEPNETKEQIEKRIQPENFLNFLQRKVGRTYKNWSDEGCLSQIFYICAVLCFCFALIVMSDVLFELQLSKR